MALLITVPTLNRSLKITPTVLMRMMIQFMTNNNSRDHGDRRTQFVIQVTLNSVVIIVKLSLSILNYHLFVATRTKVLLGEIFKEPSKYMKESLTIITSRYSRTINTMLSISYLGSKSTGDSRCGTYSMTIYRRLFHRVDGMIAQENGQEKFAENYTLDPGLTTNHHLELLRGVLQNDEEYNKLEDYISKIGDFPSQHNRYVQLLYTAREIVQQEITEMGLTIEETIVEVANVEPTTPTNSEDRTSLLPEVKEFALVRRSNNSRTCFNFSVEERSTGRFTFIDSLCKSVL
ncbi:unnamed protein product [Cyberlindnera jadinii]|uniref:Uncharacterized protein n=1 Tax=Cyberlindnera jadinii (strain ATCC 18201 / CBS 1600 / BCRC 20928 / JCM 3617 / NBRC 0987 / NRRL Y-1542) TaxID=983966 RepID=A0A0H5CBK1_CYBJN|nr:unnamed protein product [Cyberlindnera jadinii]